MKFKRSGYISSKDDKAKLTSIKNIIMNNWSLDSIDNIYKKQTIRTRSLAKSKRAYGGKRDSEKSNTAAKNPISTSTIINSYLPFKTNRSRSNKKWSKRRKGRKEYQKSNPWNKMGGDYSICSNISNYQLPQSSWGSINHSFLNTSNQIESSIATTYLRNLKPDRSFSQK